jgi:hypothetical protein
MYLPGGVSNEGCHSSSHPDQVRFEADLLDMISIDGRPLNSTTQYGFMKMIRGFDKKIRLISPRTIGRRLELQASQVTPSYDYIMAGHWNKLAC